MKIKIIFLLMMLCVEVNAQERVLPRPWGYCWPLNIPIYDTAFHTNKNALKNNKVKFYCVVDEQGKQISQSFVNKEGLVFLELEIDSIGIVKREKQTTFDSYGQETSQKRIDYNPGYQSEDGSKKLLSEHLTQYENKNGLPWKMSLEQDTNEFSDYGEAVYENGMLTGTKIVRLNNPDKFDLCEIGHIGDTLTMCGTEPEQRLLQIITKKDTVIMSGLGMWPNRTIVKDKKLVYVGNDTDHTKYFYREDGLMDYTLSKEQSSKKEKKYFYKYTYYED